MLFSTQISTKNGYLYSAPPCFPKKLPKVGIALFGKIKCVISEKLPGSKIYRIRNPPYLIHYKKSAARPIFKYPMLRSFIYYVIDN